MSSPHWTDCGLCEYPVRRRCYMRNWPPQREHMGCKLGPEVHNRGWPAIEEGPRNPALDAPTAGLRVTPDKVTRKEPGIAKKPAVADRVVAGAKKLNQTQNVKKKPAGAMKCVTIVTKPGKKVQKKMASSFVR